MTKYIIAALNRRCDTAELDPHTNIMRWEFRRYVVFQSHTHSVFVVVRRDMRGVYILNVKDMRTWLNMFMRIRVLETLSIYAANRARTRIDEEEDKHVVAYLKRRYPDAKTMARRSLKREKRKRSVRIEKIALEESTLLTEEQAVDEGINERMSFMIESSSMKKGGD